MPQKLKDKVAIVTGASKGIGASIAKHLAKEGATIVVNYASSKEGADRVVKEIQKDGGKAISVKADLSKPVEVKFLFDETLKAYKKLDILINNAGIYEFASLDKITPDHFHKIININVLGLLLASQEAIKHMGKDGGSIVNISSIASVIGSPTFTVYCASKAAVDSITKSLSKELGPRKIRVNSINPGMVETEGFETANLTHSDFRKDVEAHTPLGRIGQPNDIATAAVFLASPDASWITGESLFISGGYR